MKFLKSPIKYFLLPLLIIFSCGKDESPPIEIEKETETKVESVIIGSEVSSLLKNTSAQLTVTVSPSNASKEVLWSSSDESILTVSSNGSVTGLMMGEATITVASKENNEIIDTLLFEITGSTSNDITSVIINGKEGSINGNTFNFEFFEGTDITALIPNIIHTGISISPENQVGQDFSNSIVYSVVSENGDTEEWEIIVELKPYPESGPEFITTWKTDNLGRSEDNQITIPTFPGETYNYDVDWGDGNIDTGVNGDITHTYDVPGTYSVSITGVFPQIYFHYIDEANPKDNEKILSVDQWGDIAWKSMAFAFLYCSNLDVTATDVPNLAGVTSLNSIFTGARSLVYNSSINNWDTSTITSMQQVFSGALLFNQPVGNWDLSMVNSTARMFQSAFLFNQDISSWNVGNVTNMQSMFIHARSFNSDLSNWNVGNVTNMGGVFWDTPFNQDIGNWDTSNATSMYGMFVDNEVFNQDISRWNVANVTDMGNMFVDAISFNQDIGDWDVSNVNMMFSMFKGAISFDQNLSKWNISNVTNMTDMFLGVDLSTENYDATLIGWNDLTTVQGSIDFNGGNSQYCTGETARQNLIDTYGWTITDSGKDCN